MKFKKFNTDLENIKNSVENLINTNNNKIEELINNTKNHTYYNFIKPYQEMDERLEVEFTQAYHLNSVNNSKKSQEVFNHLLPLITEYNTKISQDERIYSIYKKIKKDEYENLDQACKKVIDDGILGFKLSGSDLNQDKKDRLKEINLKLSKLSNDFSQNVLDSTNAYELIIEDEKDIKGIPTSDLESAKIQKDGKALYRFTLQMPSYIAYMTYGPNEKLREKLYKAYSTRAPQNEKLIDEILALKDEKAKILGFKNYAELSIQTKMAKSTNEVIEFLEELAKKSKPQAKKEFEELEDFAGKKLNSWDILYYSEKLRKAKYDVDEELYRVYFEKNSVVNGLFEFLNKIFKIEFKKVKTPLWHEKASCYDIYENKQVIARIYLDLEARESKKGGAWMNNWQSYYVDSSNHTNLASAFVVCNFPPSSKTNPSLLRHNDVVTLFHEMGHAIHHLLSKVSENFVSGVNGVEWDAVEFPSQFLEEFSYEKSVLQTFAKHYKSGEVISDKMIDRLKKAKNFQSAMMMVRQLEFALFDFKLHLKLYQSNEVQALLDSIRKEVSIHIPPSYNKFQNSFSHIFAGGYAAGYYSYKWAEVLSADAFIELIERDFDEKLTKSYKENILYKGGSKSMKELFREFLNRDPKVDNLLKASGIIS